MESAGWETDWGQSGGRIDLGADSLKVLVLCSYRIVH
jgi:hypothetical protein